MSGNPDELGAGSPELAEAGTAFTGGEISIDQLRQIQRGETTLEEARGGGAQSNTDADPQPDPQSDENESDTETDQSDAQTDSSASSSGGGGSSSPQAVTNPGGSVGNTSGGGGGSSSPQAVTNPGGGVGNNQQQQQDGIDAPSIDELGELGTEFTDPNSDVSIEDVQRAADRSRLDTDGDGTIDDDDAEELADQGQFEAAQQLEEEIDQATGTQDDGTPDDLTAPTVEDVLGGDREVSSAAEADALAEAARQSDEISQERADELLDQAVDDEQGTVTSRDTGVLENQDFADQPGSAAFSEFDIAPPGGSTNPALGERTSVEDELILDRRGSAGEIESISINGEEVDVSGRSVGPETERGGDASTDRLAIDLGQLGVDPGTAEIEVEERFGAQGQLGTETTQIEALVTEDAPIVDNEAFEEQFQGTQTQDDVQNAISGSEAEAILGEETVEDLGGQQEAAAELSGIIQGQDPDPDPEPQQQPSSQQEQQQSQPDADTDIDLGLAETVGSVTRERADPTGEAEQTDTTQTAAEGEAAAAVNRFGQQQLEQQQAQSEADVVGDLAQEIGSVTRERDDPLGAAGDTAAGILSGVADFGRDARQFQRETNPIEDFAAGVREDIGVPAPGDETADLFNQPIADVFGVDVQQTRRDLARDIEGTAASAVESGQDAFGNLSPQQQQALTGAATVAAAAEPTPVGETALAALIGGTAVGAAASQQTGADETGPTESPFVDSEIPAPTEPVDSTGEITVPDEPVGSTGEITTPDEPVDSTGEITVPDEPVDSQGELDVPDETGTDPTTIITAPIGEQRRPGQRRDSGTGTGTGTGRFRRNRGADRDELAEILSGGGSIGEEVRDDIRDAIENAGEFAEEPQTAQDIIQERQVDEQTPDAEEQVGDPSLLEDIQDDDFGQGVVPGPDPILPPAPEFDTDQTPDAGTGPGVTQPPAQDQDQDPVFAPDTGQQPEVSPGIEQPATTPGTGTGTGILPDVGQQLGQQPDIDVDAGVDVGQQPDIGSLTEIITEPINAQQPQFGAEPTAPEITEPQQLAEPTGPGLGTPASPAPQTQLSDRTPRLDDDDDDEPFFDDDGEGIFGVQDVEATLDGVFGETNTDTEGGEQGGLFR